MKACEGSSSCSNRVCIGENHKKLTLIQQIYGVLLIYVPIITMPFVFFSAYVSYLHLKLMGAENIKTLSDFLPDRKSHRYNLKSQIIMRPGYSVSPTQSRLFWIFNCTWYCPVSVALFEWHAYLVKLVENWWCPFTHSKKENYKDAAIDKSFWHIYPSEVGKLTPEDRYNPIWYSEEDEKGQKQQKDQEQEGKS